jgi:hypothetical protein
VRGPTQQHFQNRGISYLRWQQGPRS